MRLTYMVPWECPLEVRTICKSVQGMNHDGFLHCRPVDIVWDLELLMPGHSLAGHSAVIRPSVAARASAGLPRFRVCCANHKKAPGTLGGSQIGSFRTGESLRPMPLFTRLVTRGYLLSCPETRLSFSRASAKRYIAT